MKIVTYGEIMDGGLNVFHSTARLDDDNHLFLTFEGSIRIDNPYRYLSNYLDELARLLPQQSITGTTIDFVKMRFSNENGCYVIMDIVDTVYNLVPGSVLVRRLIDDDWQQVTVPSLLNIEEEAVASRTKFEEVKAS